MVLGTTGPRWLGRVLVTGGRALVGWFVGCAQNPLTSTKEASSREDPRVKEGRTHSRSKTIFAHSHPEAQFTPTAEFLSLRALGAAGSVAGWRSRSNPPHGPRGCSSRLPPH